MRAAKLLATPVAGSAGQTHLDVQQLRAFLTVAEHNSFSHAASELAITQPAISKRIAALEEHLDRKLFDRLGRQVQLTEAGELLRPQAEDILQRLDELRQSLSVDPDRVAGVLRLTTSHHIGLHRLAPVLRTFRARYDGVQLDIRFEDSEIGYQRVRQGTGELAVVTLDPEGQTDLESECLWHDPLQFIGGTDFLAGKKKTNTLLALSRLPAILPGPGTYTGKLANELFARAGLRPLIAMQTNYLETIRMLVAAGYGWSALPETMLSDDLQVIRGATLKAPVRKLGLVTHPRHTPSAAANAFINVVREFADTGADSSTD